MLAERLIADELNRPYDIFLDDDKGQLDIPVNRFGVVIAVFDAFDFGYPLHILRCDARIEYVALSCADFREDFGDLYADVAFDANGRNYLVGIPACRTGRIRVSRLPGGPRTQTRAKHINIEILHQCLFTFILSPRRYQRSPLHLAIARLLSGFGLLFLIKTAFLPSMAPAAKPWMARPANEADSKPRELIQERKVNGPRRAVSLLGDYQLGEYCSARNPFPRRDNNPRGAAA